MSKRSVKKKQAAKKMRKLNKRRLKNRRKLNKQQDINKQVSSQGPIPNEDSADSKDDVKKKFDFESIFTFIMYFLLIAFFLGMMVYLIYVTCFAWPDSSEEEKPNISESSSIIENDESNFQGEEITDNGVSDPQPEAYEHTEVAPASEEDTKQPLQDLKAEFLFYDVTEHTTDELIAIASTLEFRKGPWPEGYNWRLYMDPDVELPSDDPLEISKFYADLRNKDKWTGYPVERDGFRISYDRRGRMEINNELTGVQVDEYFYYDIAEELYLRGVWDGNPTTLGSHVISISDWGGELLVDDYIVGNLQECIDLPLEFDFDINLNYFYHFGEGAYMLSNQSLIRYFRREAISVPGGPLDFSKLDLDNGRALYFCTLLYSEVWDKLFLVVHTCPNEYAGTESETAFWDIEDEPKKFLYIFPDYNVSKVKFVSEIKNFGHWGSGDDAVYFIDTNDVCWRYGESGFYKTDTPFD